MSFPPRFSRLCAVPVRPGTHVSWASPVEILLRRTCPHSAQDLRIGRGWNTKPLFALRRVLAAAAPPPGRGPPLRKGPGGLDSPPSQGGRRAQREQDGRDTGRREYISTDWAVQSACSPQVPLRVLGAAAVAAGPRLKASVGVCTAVPHGLELRHFHLFLFRFVPSAVAACLRSRPPLPQWKFLH